MGGASFIIFFSFFFFKRAAHDIDTLLPHTMRSVSRANRDDKFRYRSLTSKLGLSGYRFLFPGNRFFAPVEACRKLNDMRRADEGVSLHGRVAPFD